MRNSGRTRDLLGWIETMIDDRTRFLRHYWGEVRRVDDPMTRGRVLVQVPELGWLTDATAAWCWPRSRHSMDVPKVGEWVEVYFMGANPARPVYLGQAHEFNAQVPAGYEEGKRVLFQDPDKGDLVIYDPGARELTVSFGANKVILKDGTAELFGSSKSLVTYAALASALSGMITTLNAQLGTKLNGVGSPGSLTLDISGAEATKVKTS